MNKADTIVDIDASLNEVNSLERYIGNILENENFNSLNYLQVKRNTNNRLNVNNRIINNAEFITIDIDALAPYSTLITEKEFFRIVGANSKGIYKTSGLYQERLYGKYLEAKLLEDNGYIEDVLRKTIVFNNNVKFVKCLMENKRFMKEWRKNYGNLNPLFELKNTGKLKKINKIQNIIE